MQLIPYGRRLEFAVPTAHRPAATGGKGRRLALAQPLSAALSMRKTAKLIH